jgi:hypothetical protein
VGFVLGIGLPLVVVALGVVLLVRWLRGKSRTAHAELAAELDREPALRGPEPAVYRGSTGSYPRVSGNGQLALTANRLLFRKLVGRPVDVPVHSITGVTTARAFNGSVRAGVTHLIVHTATGDLGYYVRDLDPWVAAIEGAMRG